jgi:DNA-binding transcriptional regulator YdaS (Cro superfamily)
MQRETLQRAIEWAGNQAGLARLLGVSPQVVAEWVSKGQISRKQAVNLEHKSDGLFSRQNLRPDVKEWPND